jgi:hypothetical protein
MIGDPIREQAMPITDVLLLSDVHLRSPVSSLGGDCQTHDIARESRARALAGVAPALSPAPTKSDKTVESGFGDSNETKKATIPIHA